VRAAGSILPAEALIMFSHVVIFWTDPAKPNAPDELIAAANKNLRSIPGILYFHVGKMAASHRAVVDQSYQVALNIVFLDKQAQDDYQVHPQHVEFAEKAAKPLARRVVVYDFA
jgi:hypothetical protein